MYVAYYLCSRKKHFSLGRAEMPKLGGWVKDVDTKIFAEFAELAEFRIDTGKTHNAAPQANTCFPTLDPKNRVWARMHGTVGGQSAACAPSFFFF